SRSIKPRQLPLDLPLPLRPPLLFQALSKRPSGQVVTARSNVDRTKLHQGVGVGVVHGQNAFDPLAGFVPSTLQVGLERLLKQAFNLAAVSLGMAKPYPPNGVAKAGPPGEDRAER